MGWARKGRGGIKPSCENNLPQTLRPDHWDLLISGRNGTTGFLRDVLAYLRRSFEISSHTLSHKTYVL